MGSNQPEESVGFKPKKSVCIVGGGPVGLAALKNVLSSNSDDSVESEVFLDGILYEQSSNIGGVWNYDPELGKTLFGNPMYNNLRVNLPKQVMRFLDYSSDHYESDEDYCSQTDVLRYLNKYTDANKLRDHIRVDRTVTSVKRIPNDSSKLLKWDVSVQNTKNPSENWDYEFDHVIICSGEKKIKYPHNYEQIKNTFKGETLHSVNYIDAEKFRNQTVVLVGSGPSGRDIWIQLSDVAKHVYLSVHDFSTQTVPIPEEYKNLEQIRQLKMAKAHSVVTEDNREIDCDVIIFCTGYEYSYPFLEPGILDIKDYGKHVTPLYLHMIHMEFPTLCLLGIGDYYLPFLFNDCQSRYYVSYMRGSVMLPTRPEMMEAYNYEQIYRQRYKVDGSKSHFFNLLQFYYMRELGRISGFEDIILQTLPSIEQTFLTALKGVVNEPFEFRNKTFKDIVQESFTYSGDPTNINFNFQKDPFQLPTFAAKKNLEFTNGMTSAENYVHRI